MKTLLKTPYLHGPAWVIVLVAIFAVMDAVRAWRNINLGQLPRGLKILYLRVAIFQFDPIENPAWRTVRREALYLWAYHRVSYRVERFYHRLAISWYNYQRMGRWVYMPVAGGTTNVASRNGLFWRKVPGGLPVIQDHKVFTGNVFFVDAGTAQGGTTSGFGTHPDEAITDIDSAHNLCTATQGDTIFVLTGHVENITGASGITNDLAGIDIIGLGHGAARPTITWTATGSTWVISAASVTIENIIATATAAATLLFSSTAAHLRLHKVDYVEGSAIPLQFLLTTSASDNLKVTSSHHNAKTAGASAQLWIRLIGCDSPHIGGVDKADGNIFTLTLENGATDAAISGDGSVRSFIVAHNLILQGGGTTQVSAILFTNGATGLAAWNGVACGSTNLPGIVDVGTSGHAVENYALNTPDKSGLLDPVEDG